MKRRGARFALIPAASAVAFAGCIAHASAATPMSVFVDASHAPERIYHCKVSMPASPGAFTFVYPKWIPGFHGPVGPLPDVVNLHVLAQSNPIVWHRDPIDPYAIHTDVPATATNVEVDFDVVDAAPS
ncbi:MAG: M61 family peptidase, partial [Candidatus Baltobacteraceae bacterium]